MSRIGVRPVSIPKMVKIAVDKDVVYVEGPKGKLQFPLSERIQVAVDGEQLKVSREGDDRNTRALHGLTRAMIASMIEGVNSGFTKQLEMTGVGYRAQLSGKKITLQLGFSHPVEYAIPEGITIEVPKPTQITVKGIDKLKVGQVAANIRSLLPPEPYKGKGIRYAGEYIRRKAGKAMAK